MSAMSIVPQRSDADLTTSGTRKPHWTHWLLLWTLAYTIDLWTTWANHRMLELLSRMLDLFALVLQ
ncbi:MAG: hypothetical protein C0497_14865 [Gemmatimonas sp.]|nr:hypothetical protein [Gemmatimonas sp.]